MRGRRTPSFNFLVYFCKTLWYIGVMNELFTVFEHFTAATGIGTAVLGLSGEEQIISAVHVARDILKAEHGDIFFWCVCLRLIRRDLYV
jgi:hypothetical protein